MWFENMGVTYIGPVDGHNVRQLVRIFKEAKKMDHAVLIHVLTKRARGTSRRKRNLLAFHGVEPFDMETGKPLAAKIYPSYTDVFSKTICQIAEKDKRVASRRPCREEQDFPGLRSSIRSGSLTWELAEETR